MNLVNPKFVDVDTLAGAVDFMHKALFSPDNNVEVFQREKTNLINYLKAMNEDRSYYASRQLAALFFTDPKQSLPRCSNGGTFAGRNSRSCFNYYTEMLNHNLIDIFVLGDVEEAEVVRLFQNFDFKDRQGHSEIFISKSSRIIKKNRS